MNQIVEPSKLLILQFFAIFPRCFQQPFPLHTFAQNDLIIFRNFNVDVNSAANLVHVESVLSEKLRIWLCLFFLLVKMADMGHGKTSIVFLIIKPKIPFVWISFELVHVHPRTKLIYFYFLRVNFLVKTSTSGRRDQVRLPWQRHNCRSKYGCFCSSLQVTYLHTKIEGDLKFYVSNFALLSWRIALKFFYFQRKKNLKNIDDSIELMTTSVHKYGGVNELNAELRNQETLAICRELRAVFPSLNRQLKHAELTLSF